MRNGQWIHISTAVLLLILGQAALAQQTPNVIGTAGNYSAQMGDSAQTNRQLANQLYQQALQDEHNAWSSFPPNVSLLSKALSESKDGKAADDQAKEFARAALYGAQTGTQSGQFSLQQYGALSQDQLQSLATSSSPYTSAVQQRLGSYGMNLDPDKMSLKTPFGDFSVNMSDSALETTLRGIATVLGYSASDVSKGLAEAKATRDSLASQAQSALANQLKNRSVASTGDAKDANSVDAGKTAAAAAAAKGEAAGIAAGPSSNEANTDWDKEEQRFVENQNRVKRALGLQAAPVPLGHKNDDIFQMVHNHYQQLRSTGVFIETDQIFKVTANNF